MSSALQKIMPQPLTSEGFFLVQGAVGTHFVEVADDSRKQVPGIGNCFINTSGHHAQTQHLVIRHSSWAERNIQMTIASTGAPVEEELAAARAAIERLSARAGENVDDWAAELGRKFGSIID